MKLYQCDWCGYQRACTDFVIDGKTYDFCEDCKKEVGIKLEGKGENTYPYISPYIPQPIIIPYTPPVYPLPGTTPWTSPYTSPTIICTSVNGDELGRYSVSRTITATPCKITYTHNLAPTAGSWYMAKTV